jgi:hypothetical protein
MFRRATFATLAAIAVSIGSAHTAAAQDLAPRPLLFAAVEAATLAPAAPAVEPAASATQPAFVRSAFDGMSGRSSVLTSLYVSTAMVHALDVHSTFRVLENGGAEGNPLLSGLVSKRPAFIAFKAAVATSSIMLARQIAKKNKVAAIITLVGIDSAYAMVISHNYQLARQLGQR